MDYKYWKKRDNSHEENEKRKHNSHDHLGKEWNHKYYDEALRLRLDDDSDPWRQNPNMAHNNK